jgi:hypothetical protein
VAASSGWPGARSFHCTIGGTLAGVAVWLALRWSSPWLR